MLEKWRSYKAGRGPAAREAAPTLLLTHPVDTLIDTLQEQSRGKGYYQLVPQEYKGIVDNLVRFHHPSFATEFPKVNDFAQSMSANWLAKFRAFPRIAEETGFVDGRDLSLNVLNESLIAGLSSNSSFVLLGSGSYARTGDGARLEYTRLPLRDEETIADRSADKGAYLRSRPRVGEPLKVYIASRDKDLQTTPLLSLQVKQNPQDIASDMSSFQATIRVATRKINDWSGFRMKRDR